MRIFQIIGSYQTNGDLLNSLAVSFFAKDNSVVRLISCLLRKPRVMALSGLITESIKFIVRMYCHSSLSHYKLKVLSHPLSLNHAISSIIINQSDLCTDQGKPTFVLE